MNNQPYGCIYGLGEPDTNKIRYIGFSTQPQKRYLKHLSKNKLTTHKACWVRSLQNKGLKPFMEIIDEASELNWKEKEKHYIRLFKSFGAKLVNSTIGGDGLNGYVYTPEVRKKISEAGKGRVSANKGKKYSEEQNKKTHGDKWKQSMSKPRTLEYRQKLSIVHKERLKANTEFAKGQIERLRTYRTKALKNSLLKTQKEYLIITPYGSKIKIFGLRSFCNLNNLNSSHMVAIAKKRLITHKGYKCFYANNKGVDII